MKPKKRKQQVNVKKLVIVLIIVILVLFGAFLGLRYLKQKITERFADTETSSILTAEVTTGSISTTVYGKGTLSNEDSETLTLPSTVEVTDIYVSVGDSIQDGDLLASVNSSTVLQAMAEKQSEIDALDEELADISEDTISDTVTASVSGRVKLIYASEGDDVTELMVDKNALMVLSLDGYMAVDIETEALSRKDTVTVTTEDGTAYEGTVSSIAGNKAVILITDDGPENDAKVTVSDSEGTGLGTGNLYIHEQVTVIGFAGTVSTVDVEENQSVAAGDTLLTLTDVSYSANYATLLKERKELEEELQELLKVYREGGVYAHSSGTVTAVSEGKYAAAKTSSSSSASMMGASGFSFGSSATTASSSSSSGSDTTISYCPGEYMEVTISVDEADILSLTVGQEASVYISSLSEDAYAGTLTEVGNSGTSSNGVTSYTAVVQIEKQEGMLSGMTATAYVTIEGTDNALLIPAEALTETSTTAFVYTTYDEETDTLGGMVEVELGLQNSRYVEIRSGLEEGDTVYYKDETEENSFDFGGFGGNGNMPGGFSFDFNNIGGGSSDIPGNIGGGSSGGGNMPGGGNGGNGGNGGGNIGGGSGMPSLGN